jgi:hypothetical protein
MRKGNVGVHKACGDGNGCKARQGIRAQDLLLLITSYRLLRCAILSSA